ncbi:ABC transporter substrate-binding protein [Streptomyces sp. 1331.2]|uniref:ABC transporter substrate-binding protein n=1 Tax=Streptomyces sp. 1331.2 TaxID=1938835 RepID=UPI000BC975EC|nr:ABC transporter substrate-binding protein [Streptomyces sp. 1331.2]SOB81019.1 amino acid/amide ABC transporter substrate-binding protein, HAAT family [Streptomyces sp. 1331.2]
MAPPRHRAADAFARRRPGRVPAAALALLLTSLPVLAALSLSGCGTRLPGAAFSARSSPPAAPTGSAGPGATGSGTTNPASDTGVTATEIRIGVVTSLTSPVGSEVFSGPRYGAQAFFQALNDRGGLHGRTVRLVTCDDGGSGVGNQDCVHRLVDQAHVFAFVSGSVLDYAGASYVSGKAVPDIGGQPIGTAYDRWPHLYGIYGSAAPRDGRAVGWNGTLYQSTEVFRFFKQHLGAGSAAVVAYNQADSARYAGQLKAGLEAEGYRVLLQTVDFALPNFQAVAAAVHADGSQLLFDAMDTRGNAALCRALDEAGVTVAAKVTNVQNWSESVRTDYASSPNCRNALWATSSSLNYEDQQYPAVRDFRTAMARYYPDRAGQLSAWELEGWAGAQWLADALDSCGAAPTRSCVEAFMNRAEPYDAHGLILPASFVPQPPPAGPTRACLNAARWQDSAPGAQGGQGGWVTQVPSMAANCFDVPQLPYKP